MKALYPIVGMKWQLSAEFVASLPNGTPLALKRDAANPYDPNAIQVWTADSHIGYISAKDAKILAPLIDASKSLSFDFANGRRLKLVFPANSHYPHVEIDE